MGLTLPPRAASQGSGGAASPARDAAGPANTAVRLWTWQWRGLSKRPQTPRAGGEPLKPGQASQSLLKFTVRGEVDELDEHKRPVDMKNAD